MRMILTTIMGNIHDIYDEPASYHTSRSGPGNPFSTTVGFGWLKATTDIFSAGPGSPTPGGNFTPPPLVMSFTVRI